MEEQVLYGLVASKGIAVGPLVHWSHSLVCNRCAGNETEEEILLNASIATAHTEVTALMATLDEISAEIMEFQQAMFEDEDFLHPVKIAIKQGVAADAAWRQMCDAEIRDYANSDSEYLAARVDDLRDIRDRVLRIISGGQTHGNQDLAPGGVVFAQDLTPSEFLAFDWQHLSGAALRSGSPTSHVSILARARGIPLVVGLKAPPLSEMNGTQCVLDAVAGRLIIAPSQQTLMQVKTVKSGLNATSAKADSLRNQPAVSADGVAVKVMINVDNPSALKDMDVANCDGIGLFRTEFLIEGNTLPDEEAQLAIYKQVLSWAEGKPVTIRTFDAGGDKPVPGLSLPDESNPFLGVRGVRLSLTMPEIFKTQLRALVRANEGGNLKIMIPMVTVPAEMAQVKALLDEVCNGLKDYNRPQLGMMIEVPATALTAMEFDTDFFSIGSNDLIQYTMAAARDNPAVSYLAQADNPAINALITHTIKVANTKNIEVSLCGDMASNEDHTARLLQMGLRIFSVSPALLGHVKLAISSATSGGLKDEQS